MAPTNRAIGSPERRFPSPLRYPGGKGKIANYIKLLLIQNDLVGCDYVELYAGGAGIALSLLYEGLVDRAHINDIDRSVHAFWNAAINHTDELCRLIRDTEVTVEEWRRQQEVQAAGDPEPVELGFSTFFLNRTNRSGVLNAGVIGGLDQTGGFGIDARYNKEALTRRIEKMGRYSRRIVLTRVDAADYLRGHRTRLPESALFYLDPPYYGQGQRLYHNSYALADHSEVAALVQQQCNYPWIVSYDVEPEILALYPSATKLLYGVPYSAAEHYEGSEVMFFSPDLRKPAVASPTAVRFKEVDRALLATVKV